MNALEIHGLTKKRGEFALQGLELTLPAGCIMGLIGENGAGKSTTIRLILNSLGRDGGTVAVYGRDNRALTALERDILGEERQGDIDGAEIPGRYYRYLRTGEEGLLSDIVLHNRLDVATMPALAGELCRLLENPETAGHVQDIKSLGRIYHRQGELETAEKLYSLSGAIACRELGLLYKKEGRLEEAAAVWVQMVQKGLGGVFPHVELAKYAEHTLKDYEAACDWTQKALRFPLLGAQTQAELRHRLHRLQGKLAREREQKEEAT